MNSISDPHLNKRIAEFRERGFDVELYGFDRCLNKNYGEGVKVIGSFSNTMSYAKRIGIYVKGIRSLFKNKFPSGAIWYYQGLDVAMFATLFNPNHAYIYEECDLVHTNVGNKLLLSVLEHIDKRIIKRSVKTVFTSEGFVEYHYGDIGKKPHNVVVVPNKLPSAMLAQTECSVVGRGDSGLQEMPHLRFAFVGGLRYKALASIAGIIAGKFHNHEFHFYGFVAPDFPKHLLPKGSNVFYHGTFKSPDDLPKIYSNIDVLVSTYDVMRPNVRYAEPNKLYESVFFRCPIVVSRGTFLARKVERLGIGYSVDAFDVADVERLVGDIESTIGAKKTALEHIDRTEAVEQNSTELIINEK